MFFFLFFLLLAGIAPGITSHLLNRAERVGFLERSKPTGTFLDELSAWHNAVYRLPIKGLLRSLPRTPQMFMVLVQKAQLAQQDCYRAALELDRVAPVYDALMYHSSWQPSLASSVRSIICEDTLPDHTAILSTCSFWEPERVHHPNLRRAIQHLLSKGLPLRCGGRKWDDVIRRYIVRFPHFSIFLQRLLFCSILGNYRSSTYRLTFRSRRKLLALTPDERHNFLLRVFDHCFEWLFFAVREYSCYLLDISPVLTRHLDGLFRVQNFAFTVDHVMSTVRRFVDAELDHLDNAALLTSHRGTLARIVDSLKAIHSAMLPMSFQRSQQKLMSVLKSYKQSKKGLGVLSAEQRRLLKLFICSIHPEHPDPLDICIRTGFLSALGLDLKHIMRICHAKSEVDVQELGKNKQPDLFIKLKTDFPLAYDFLVEAADVWSQHTQFRTYPLPAHYVASQLNAVRERFYCLDEKELLKPENKDLPVPLEQLLFVYCEGCQMIYSHLQEAKVKDMEISMDERGVVKRSKNKRLYDAWGLRHPITDYVTSKVYCAKPRCRPERIELKQILLLGNALVFKGDACSAKLIILCPQPGCGKPMTIRHELCLSNHLGPMCPNCSKRACTEHTQRMLVLAEKSILYDEKTSKCAMCGKQPSIKKGNQGKAKDKDKDEKAGGNETANSTAPKTNESLVFIAPGLFVCDTHGKKYRDVINTFRDVRLFPENEKQFVDFCQQKATRQKEYFDAIYAERNKRELAASKRTLRSKRG